MQFFRSLRYAQIIACAAGSFTLHANAAEIIAQVTDAKHQPVEDAVIYVNPLAEKTQIGATQPPTAIMDQWELQFIPYVLPVQRGTEVEFPNRDRIKHHVYSFSPTKRFELKLYSGKKGEPVTFNQSGIVALGCNIHDWMLGYIYVVDTPYFAKTDAKGVATISDLPPGQHRVEIWHPRLKRPSSVPEQNVQVTSDRATQLQFQVAVKPDRRRKAPADNGNGYTNF